MKDKKEFTTSWVSDVLGLHLVEAPRKVFPKIVTDSRKIEKDCLFIAIKGEKFDGHDFLEQVIKQGAAAVICRASTPVTQTQGVLRFSVEDTEVAFRKLAAAWRKLFSIPVIVVAGSVGKTTTKELLAAALLGKYKKVLKTQGSQNGFLGIPMTLLELRDQHDVAVIEVGIDEPGSMIQHMSLVASTHAVLTAIGPEHLEKLIDLQTVAREEKIALQFTAQQGGRVAIHLDDAFIEPLINEIPNGLGFSLNNHPQAQFKAKWNESSQELQMGESRFSVPLPGVHNAANALCALAICELLGLTHEEMRTGLTTFKNPGGRSELKHLVDGTPVLCDYYNANPTSVCAAVQVVTELAAGRPRWVCLGDMLELGAQEEALHRSLADLLLSLTVENVLLYGERMKWLELELQSRGFAGFVEHFNSHEALVHRLLQDLRVGDTVLIKGSRGMKMENAWKIFSEARGVSA